MFAHARKDEACMRLCMDAKYTCDYACVCACTSLSELCMCSNACMHICLHMYVCAYACTCDHAACKHACISTLPVVHLAETHTAEVSGAIAACGAAGDLLVCDTDEQPHGPPPKSPLPPDCSPSQLSETQSQREAEASAAHPAGSSLSD